MLTDPLTKREPTQLEDLNQILIEKSMCFTFKTSNKQAEYETILVGLLPTRKVEVRRLACKIDSKLTMGHLNDEYQIKNPMLLQYYHLVRDVMNSSFDEITIQHIPRGDNMRVKTLSKLASTRKKEKYKSLLHQTLMAPSIANTYLNLHTNNDNWMSPHIYYLKTDNPPPNNMDKRWMSKIARYTLIGDDLYKRGYGQPLLKCVTKE